MSIIQNEAHMQQKLDSMRNEMAGKISKFDRPIFGYQSPTITRTEGEVWLDDDGKTWTMKNGLIQSISKLQDAKTPWWCPKCEKAMGHRFDDKFYKLYQMCYDCTIKHHTNMMLDGSWEVFEKRMVRANEMAWLKDHIMECKEYIRNFKTPQVHFENGGWEELANIEQFKELFESIRENISLCEARLAVLVEEEKSEAYDAR